MDEKKMAGRLPQPLTISRRKFLGGMAVVGAGLLAGCAPKTLTPEGPTEEAPTAAPGPTAVAPTLKTFIFGAAEEPGDLDPHYAPAAMTSFIIRQVAPPLLRWAPDLTFTGALAETWDVSEDGLTWDFILRDNAYFHSGKKVTAQEVIRNYDRIFDPAEAVPTKDTYSVVDGFEAVDERTVRFVLKEPSAPFMAALAYANGIVDMDEYAPNNPIGAGPFKFVEWERGSHVKLVKHDRYWEAGLPKVDVMDWRFFPDLDVLLMAFQAGEIDAIQMVPFKAAQAIDADPNLVLYTAPGMTDYYITLNVSEPPFDDLKVRQAVAHAINKQDVIDAALFGWGVPTNGSYPEGTVWYNEVTDYEYDPAKARQLLTEAGYPDGFSVEMPIPTWTPAPEFSQAVQALLKEVGIQVELVQYEWAAYLDEIWKCGAFNISMMADVGYPDPDLRYNWLFRSDSVDNVMCYSNARVDELLAQGRTTMDQDERVAAYAELQQILSDELPVIWVYLRKQLRAWQTYVKDFPEHGCSDYFLYFDKVDVDK